jgi:hypothetical protein
MKIIFPHSSTGMYSSFPDIRIVTMRKTFWMTSCVRERRSEIMNTVLIRIQPSLLMNEQRFEKHSQEFRLEI